MPSQFFNALLKRIMLLNNEEKGEEYVAENYDKSIEELTWHLIKEQLVEANDIKVEQEDVLKMARETTPTPNAWSNTSCVNSPGTKRVISSTWKLKSDLTSFAISLSIFAR